MKFYEIFDMTANMLYVCSDITLDPILLETSNTIKVKFPLSAQYSRGLYLHNVSYRIYQQNLHHQQFGYPKYYHYCEHPIDTTEAQTIETQLDNKHYPALLFWRSLAQAERLEAFKNYVQMRLAVKYDMRKQVSYWGKSRRSRGARLQALYIRCIRAHQAVEEARTVYRKAFKNYLQTVLYDNRWNIWVKEEENKFFKQKPVSILGPNWKMYADFIRIVKELEEYIKENIKNRRV